MVVVIIYIYLMQFIVSLKGEHKCLNNLNILFTSNSTNYVECQKPF